MQTTAPRLELNEDDSPSIWPWIIGAIALILLSISVRSDLKQIPRNLAQQAGSVASLANASNINIAVDGRDLNLSGTLSPGINRDALVQRIADINGVRVVVDDLTEFDPEEQARLRQLDFKQSIDNIDFSNVAFERGSASLTSSSQSTLLQLVQVLNANPEFRIRVAGHTDNTGRAEVNLRISRERAASVANFLVDNGVNARQLIAQGYGATRPIADNSTEAGRAANRRIEINYVN